MADKKEVFSETAKKDKKSQDKRILGKKSTPSPKATGNAAGKATKDQPKGG